MPWPILIYRLLLPIYLMAAFPGWLLKMAKRGGFGSGLRERIGLYGPDQEFEPNGAVHVHAVSVGETLLAMKFIGAWQRVVPQQGFVLAVATATGHRVACDTRLEGVRVVYQPLDAGWLVNRYLARFEPKAVVLVEGEMWPNLLLACERRAIPVGLVNARMSPRSRRRYLKLAPLIRPIFSKLDRVAIQIDQDAEVWRMLGVDERGLRCTGSLKFDALDAGKPTRRKEFGQMIEACRKGRPVLLAASTHPGEEVLVARAAKEAGVFLVCVPRHAERRREVAKQLADDGFQVVLRSEFEVPEDDSNTVLVVDSTGELRDWTAHADAVVIGKSLLGIGGQNPAEAIQAGIPLIFGSHMENFQPLADQLVHAGGAIRVDDAAELTAGIRSALRLGTAPDVAMRCLEAHSGATLRAIEWMRAMISENRQE